MGPRDGPHRLSVGAGTGRGDDVLVLPRRSGGHHPGSVPVEGRGVDRGASLRQHRSDNRFFPVAGSDRGEQGMAPFAKHPVYPLLLASADRVGGTAAMVVLSVQGTVASAGFAALLAREVTGGRERAVLWAVGLASPLLFDAYLLIAHSMGAALVTAATLAVVRGIRSSRPALPMAVGIGLVVAAVLLRTEALIFALALGDVTAAGDRHGHHRGRRGDPALAAHTSADVGDAECGRHGLDLGGLLRRARPGDPGPTGGLPPGRVRDRPGRSEVLRACRSPGAHRHRRPVLRWRAGHPIQRGG